MNLEQVKSLPYDGDPSAGVCDSCPARFGLTPENCPAMVLDMYAEIRNRRVGRHLFKTLEASPPDDIIPVCVHPLDSETYMDRTK
jgi:hypothetical protein